MRSRFVGTLAVALTSLGIFAGTAGASSHDHGISGGASVNSVFSSPVGGTCNAAFNTPAGNNSDSYTSTSFFLGYPAEFCYYGEG
jgi:hypothetical protein